MGIIVKSMAFRFGHLVKDLIIGRYDDICLVAHLIEGRSVGVPEGVVIFSNCYWTFELVCSDGSRCKVQTWKEPKPSSNNIVLTLGVEKCEVDDRFACALDEIAKDVWKMIYRCSAREKYRQFCRYNKHLTDAGLTRNPYMRDGVGAVRFWQQVLVVLSEPDDSVCKLAFELICNLYGNEDREASGAACVEIARGCLYGVVKP